ncbi:MAG: PAS domain S-box protein [Gemmatimonadaceae bacterium]|nr:PAS domain S-box protein [Gemmatimonadaceae bacterium]
MMRPRPRWLPHSLAGPTQGLCAATILFLLLSHPFTQRAALIADVLLVVQLAGIIAVAAVATQSATGTRRTICLAIAIAACFAFLGRLSWTVFVVQNGSAPIRPLLEATTGASMQLTIAIGLLAVLARHRHRNWMRFEMLIDALLLSVAVSMLVVQADLGMSDNADASPLLRAFALSWNILAAANMVLVTLLLIWRGEALGSRVAVGLSLGLVTLALANFLYSRLVLLDGMSVPRSVFGLWTLTEMFLIYAISPRPSQQPLGESRESPMYASESAKVRTFSIVAAILIASWSGASVAFGGAPSPLLGFGLLAFGVLLALRAGHALFAQQQATVVLEHVALAERELSAILEQRVALRTEELAEAHRVLQRMWALGQQIALELNPGKVLQRFLEASVDVLRADGGAIGLVSDERISITTTSGHGDALAGASFAVQESTLGRVTRNGNPWTTSDARTERAGDDVLVCTEARGLVAIPLHRRAERIGAMFLFVRERRTITDREMAHVEAMADLLSVALANAELVETLRKAEWRFRTLFRAAPDAVLTVLQSGRIREANDAVQELVGMAPVQLVGRMLEDLVLPEDRSHLADQVARVMEGEEARFEVRVWHGHGVRIASLAARLLPEADPPQMLVVVRDMTADREMRARLAESERLASAGELLAGVAHEVNNPLSTISAFAQLLEREELSESQRESVEVIRSETMRASQVVRDLLTFARRSEGEVGSIDMNELVERTMRLRMHDLKSRSVHCETVLATDLPYVTADARQIQQVLLNLLTNASQAMTPSGGGQLRIETRQDGDRVLLEITDSGPGIPADVRAHIFEPFFTTKEDGTGLGLSVSYGIIAAHGGRITIPKSTGEGTTFCVSLPAYDPNGNRSGGVATVLATPSPLEGVRMLFVTSDSTVRGSVQAFARLRGFHVTSASDGAAALACLRSEAFDLAVCDLDAPGLREPEFISSLRSQQPSLARKLLFLNAREDEEAGFQGKSLAKPFELDRMEGAAAVMLNGGKRVSGSQLMQS